MKGWDANREIVWALVYTLLSMALGQVLKKMFKFPAWTVPAICFNNTTALPLLLIQSLDSAGILDSLLKDESDSTSDAVKRAKSYFLVSAVVGNALTFTMGPKLLDDEESPDAEEGEEQKPLHDQTPHRQGDEEEANAQEPESSSEDDTPAHETTTLLPRPIDGHVLNAIDKTKKQGNRVFEACPEWLQKSLSFAAQFINAPIVGALIGAFLGLTPGVNTWFFAKPDEGGYFKAWLTQSIENIGDLFATLQLVVVGSKLSASLAKAKKGEDSGKVDWKPLATIFLIRFLLWPAASISLIWVIASKTSWLTPDPILWFVMMLMPTGPPATKLTALADVSGAEEKQKLAISKFLTISYAASPVICIAVVGSLKAVKSVMEKQGM